MARQNGMAVSHVYSAALKGFAGTIPDVRLQAVMNDPAVVRAYLGRQAHV